MKKNDIRHSVLFVMFMYSFICIFHLTYLRVLLLSACSNLFVSALAYKNIFFLSLLLLFVFALSLQEVISLLSALSLSVSLWLPIFNNSRMLHTNTSKPITEKQPNVSNNNNSHRWKLVQHFLAVVIVVVCDLLLILWYFRMRTNKKFMCDKVNTAKMK